MSKKDYNFTDQKELAIKLSQKTELQPYLNNLDKVLGIKTVNTCKSIAGVRFNLDCKTFLCDVCKQNPKNTKQLEIFNKKLYINDRDYDWYITAKDNSLLIFFIRGFNKRKKEIISYTLIKNKREIKLTEFKKESF